MSATRPTTTSSAPQGGSRKVAKPHFLETTQAKNPATSKSSFLQTIRAVGWSFFGVRRAADHAQDVAQLNPVHVVIAGITGAGLFVTALVFLVKWVVGSGVAA